MSRRVQLVIVCEDSQQEAFARRFLLLQGWQKRDIRVEKAPRGKGAGEQFVRERYPDELSAYRQRKHKVALGLVVITDGDNEGFSLRRARYDKLCTDQGIEPRQADEAVAILIPTWNIKTWLSYLSGETVDESKSNYPRLERARDCQPMVEALNAMCLTRELRQPTPLSLLDACEEYQRIRKAVK